MNADTSGQVKVLPPISMRASSLGPREIWYAHISAERCTSGESKRRPIRRFAANTVLRALVMAWRLARWPTRRLPSWVIANIEGVVL